MKNKLIAFFGLVLVLIFSNLYLYSRALVDGKVKYQHSKNFQMTLESQYRFGHMDGETDGFLRGYIKGSQDTKLAFLKLSPQQKERWCK